MRDLAVEAGWFDDKFISERRGVGGEPGKVEEEEGDDGGDEDGGEGALLAVLRLSPAPPCLPPLQRLAVRPAERGEDLKWVQTKFYVLIKTWRLN